MWCHTLVLSQQTPCLPKSHPFRNYVAKLNAQQAHLQATASVTAPCTNHRHLRSSHKNICSPRRPGKGNCCNHISASSTATVHDTAKETVAPNGVLALGLTLLTATLRYHFYRFIRLFLPPLFACRHLQVPLLTGMNSILVL